jgi:acyl-coenzyme A synthetase/AMP-(fatty) acid ligase
MSTTPPRPAESPASRAYAWMALAVMAFALCASWRHVATFVTELPKTAIGKIQKYVLRGRRAAIALQ